MGRPQGAEATRRGRHSTGTPQPAKWHLWAAHGPARVAEAPPLSRAHDPPRRPSQHFQVAEGGSAARGSNRPTALRTPSSSSRIGAFIRRVPGLPPGPATRDQERYCPASSMTEDAPSTAVHDRSRQRRTTGVARASQPGRPRRLPEMRCAERTHVHSGRFAQQDVARPACRSILDPPCGTRPQTAPDLVDPRSPQGAAPTS